MTNLKDFAEILASLEQSLTEAGGSVDWSRLDRMNAITLLEFLAPNKIRFIHKEDK